jgi:hypothetical protein
MTCTIKSILNAVLNPADVDEGSSGERRWCSGGDVEAHQVLGGGGSRRGGGVVDVNPGRSSRECDGVVRKREGELDWFRCDVVRDGRAPQSNNGTNRRSK